MNRAVGLAALTVLELPHEEQVSVAAQAGYSHVGLRLIPVAGQPVIHAFDAAEVERRLSDTGVGVLDVEVFRLTPQTNIKDFEAVMATAQRLGATELLVHGADSDEARLIETFGRLCDLAAGYGLSANLEPMPWVEVSNLAKAMRIVDGAARANGGLLVDAIHFFRAGDSPQALAKVPRKFLRYMQLCDARAERPSDLQEIIRQARSDRLFPGEGGLDLKGLLRALPSGIPISLEIPISRKMEPLERASRALEAARAILTMEEQT
ncbi:MAG: sugar phosphate isomerase/epimerase [Betaproteobacteria bacterium]|nr:MAG: sugar phosphate isomerase/epimerase [Betaproteobacteria bacterium]